MSSVVLLMVGLAVALALVAVVRGTLPRVLQELTA